jgi:hypothetical protein
VTVSSHVIPKRRSQLGFVTYLLNCPRTIKQISTLPSEFLDNLHRASLVANVFTPSTQESPRTHIFFLFLPPPHPICLGLLFRLLFTLFVLSAAVRNLLTLFMYLSTTASCDKVTYTTTNQREFPRCSICRSKHHSCVCALSLRRFNDSNPEAGCLSRLTSANIILQYLFIPETRFLSPAVYEVLCVMTNRNVTTDTTACCSKFAVQYCLQQLKNGTIQKLTH